jgi:hypothetical protein
MIIGDEGKPVLKAGDASSKLVRSTTRPALPALHTEQFLTQSLFQFEVAPAGMTLCAKLGSFGLGIGFENPLTVWRKRSCEEIGFVRKKTFAAENTEMQEGFNHGLHGSTRNELGSM